MLYRTNKEKHRKLLLSLLIGEDSKMYKLCDKYFNLRDLVGIASRGNRDWFYWWEKVLECFWQEKY